jgi:hypothetical protein
MEKQRQIRKERVYGKHWMLEWRAKKKEKK